MFPEIISAKSVEFLQAAMAQMPQWGAAKHTSHYFSDQMYCRMLFRPAGTLIVGKRHKKAHFYIVCQGTVQVTSDESPAVEMTGPCVIECQPGAKRAVLALTDATCLTVHHSKKRSLKALEKELVEPDENALYDARNHRLPRKQGALS